MENTNDNYNELLKCPQNAYLSWKIEDNNEVCAENKPGYVDWHNRHNVMFCLGYLLDSANHNEWIYPAANKNSSNTGCGIATEVVWKDTTKVKAHQSDGNVTLFYSGRKL